jgi:methylglutaconyl-CoA hydratase
MISAERVGQVAILRLDRASKKNALTPPMLRDLAQQVSNSASARAIVLSGVGEVFCAGFDLTLARDDAGALGELIRGLSAAVRALRGAPCPVVASAHGAALAGGCALLCGCDLAVTDAGAKIGYPALRLGISPAVSAAHLLAGVGPGAARALMLDPGVIDGERAYRVGLVSHVVAGVGECEPAALELARGLASKPPHAMGHTKRWLNQLDGSLDEAAIEAGLAASLAGIGSQEQTTLLARAWAKG